MQGKGCASIAGSFHLPRVHVRCWRGCRCPRSANIWGTVERSAVVLAAPQLQQVSLTNLTFPHHPRHLLLSGSSLQQFSASLSFSQTSLCKPPNGPFQISTLALEEILPKPGRDVRLIPPLPAEPLAMPVSSSPELCGARSRQHAGPRRAEMHLARFSGAR